MTQNGEGLTVPPKLGQLTRNEKNDEGKQLRIETANNKSDAADDENGSIASGRSDDSEMEPFLGYLPKIQRLLSDIGLEGFSVEALQHGYTFQNCVYVLEPSDNDKEQYILRVPLCPDMTDGKCLAIENDAALLRYLADKLPVPRVKAYSTTADNALDAPFTIQTRLPGRALDGIYNDLPHEDKLLIIDQFVELLVSLESIILPKAGTFTAPSLPPSTSDSNDAAIPLISTFKEGDDDFVKDPQVLQDRRGPELKTFLVSHLKGWISKEIKEEEISEWGSFTLPSLRQLLAIVDELDDEGAFKDAPYPVILSHWDLEPRNIMVERSSGCWRICGIIDWDDSLALPRPLARRPPDWIWEINKPPGFTGYLDNDHHPNDHISEEGSVLKAYFDTKADATLSNYLEDAYGSGRWLRRIWTFARSGADSCWYIDLIKKLPTDWEARPKPAVS
ncbi:MAG: hypothetical protein Q9201_004788 [Fulgogasparrea decipioides]